MSTALIAVWLPREYVRLLRESESLWDGKDRFRYDRYGKLPATRKVIRELIRKHLILKHLLKE